MYTKKLDEDIRCPLEYGFRMFGGKWKSRVLCVLADAGTIRYSDLRREMVNISDTVLSSTLKELLQDGLIQKQQYQEIPPRVEYRLSERGASVIPVLQHICRWAGIFYREDGELRPSHCQKCDYNSPQ